MPVQSSSVGLPKTIDEVDAGFLTDALCLRWPGTKVTHVEHDQVIRGTGTKLRLKRQYNEVGRDHGLPPTMWFKGGFEAHSATVWNAHEHEALFYHHFGCLAVVEAPLCYFASQGIDGVPGAVLISDLLDAGATFVDGAHPIAPEQVSKGLLQMAAYHARWWDSAQLSLLGVAGGSLAKDQRLATLSALWTAHLALPRCETIPEKLRDPAYLLPRAADAKADGISGPSCFLHGDAHLGNWYFLPDGRLGLLDWQCVMAGNWVHDVNYFLVGSLAPADRKAHERELLQLYLDRLTKLGCPAPDFDDAWALYTRQSYRGACWFLTPAALQSEDVIKAQSERFWRALEEHDMLR